MQSDGVIQKIYGVQNAFGPDDLDKNDIELADKDGRTLLIHSVLAKNFGILQWLITAGANVNAKDKQGWTALHYAVQNHLSEFVQLLVSHGADVNAQDEYGNSALWRAVFASQGRGEIIKFLMTNGGDPNLKNFRNISPIQLANTIANYDVKKFLQ